MGYIYVYIDQIYMYIQTSNNRRGTNTRVLQYNKAMLVYQREINNSNNKASYVGE